MPHILIICTANICRSPVAEALLRERLHQQGLPDWSVSSAGTWAHIKRGASQFSIEVMARQGIDLRGHQAQVVTERMLQTADLVLCMESGHVEALKAEFPTQAAKIYLLSEMVGKSYNVSDPYGGPIDAYERMATELTNLLDIGLARIITLAAPTNHETI